MRNGSAISNSARAAAWYSPSSSIERSQCNRKQMVEIDSRENCGRHLWVFSVC
jgi:hypothetical protein